MSGVTTRTELYPERWPEPPLAEEERKAARKLAALGRWEESMERRSRSPVGRGGMGGGWEEESLIVRDLSESWSATSAFLWLVRSVLDVVVGALAVPARAASGGLGSLASMLGSGRGL